MPVHLLNFPSDFPRMPDVDTAQTFTISELAREFGITPRTIRFWEDQGLLAPQREGRNRVFSRRDRARLKMALRGKRLGLSLAEIKDLIGMYVSAGDKTSQLQECLRVITNRRAALSQQLEDIAAVLGELKQFEQLCRELLQDRGEASGIEGEPLLAAELSTER
ncbi:MAG: hypothetical protein RIR00_49 [Pseudomonadota bacterium]|jgi:DNA-binding transcriptional MerR regulator